MTWRIVQQGPHEWAVECAGLRHFAQTAMDAVALKAALEAADRGDVR